MVSRFVLLVYKPRESCTFVAISPVPVPRRNLSRSLTPSWEKSVFWKGWAEACVLCGRWFVRGIDFFMELFGVDELLCCVWHREQGKSHTSALIFMWEACLRAASTRAAAKHHLLTDPGSWRNANSCETRFGSDWCTNCRPGCNCTGVEGIARSGRIVDCVGVKSCVSC